MDLSFSGAADLLEGSGALERILLTHVIPQLSLDDLKALSSSCSFWRNLLLSSDSWWQACAEAPGHLLHPWSATAKKKLLSPSPITTSPPGSFRQKLFSFGSAQHNLRHFQPVKSVRYLWRKYQPVSPVILSPCHTRVAFRRHRSFSFWQLTSNGLGDKISSVSLNDHMISCATEGWQEHHADKHNSALHAWSPTQPLFALPLFSTQGCAIQIVHVPTGEVISEWHSSQAHHERPKLREIAFSSNGSQLAISTYDSDHPITLINLHELAKDSSAGLAERSLGQHGWISQLQSGPPRNLCQLQFSPDGTFLSSMQSHLRRYGYTSGMGDLTVLRTHGFAIQTIEQSLPSRDLRPPHMTLAFAWAPTGTHAACIQCQSPMSTTYDVVVLQTATWRIQDVLESISGGPHIVQYTQCGRFLAVTDSRATLIYDVQNEATPQRVLRVYVSFVTFSPDCSAFIALFRHRCERCQSAHWHVGIVNCTTGASRLVEACNCGCDPDAKLSLLGPAFAATTVTCSALGSAVQTVCIQEGGSLREQIPSIHALRKPRTLLTSVKLFTVLSF